MNDATLTLSLIALLVLVYATGRADGKRSSERRIKELTYALTQLHAAIRRDRERARLRGRS